MTESDYENAAPVNISEVDTSEVTLPDNSNVVAPPEKPDNSSVSVAGTSEGLDGTVEPEVTEEMDGHQRVRRGPRHGRSCDGRGKLRDAGGYVRS